MEQDNIFKQCYEPQPPATTTTDPMVFILKDTRPGIQYWFAHPVNFGVTSRYKLKMFECPSDNVREELTAGVFVAMHAGDPLTITGGYYPTPTADTMGRTNYAACSGVIGSGWNGGAPYAFYAQYEGIMTNRSDTTLGQVAVQDGTSNTLLFGETLGGTVTPTRDFARAWMGCGTLVTAWGLGRGQLAGSAQWYRFSSRHAAVVQFCFGDCSTRGVRFGQTTTFFTEDWYVLAELSGRKDGGNRDRSSLVD
jgi:hypothetical protein